MKRTQIFLIAILSTTTAVHFAAGERAADLRKDQKDRAQRAVKKDQEKRAQQANIEINGTTAFKEKELRSQLKEQITTIDDLGLTTARADDAAFFLELFYRKHGYAKVAVRYAIEGGNRLRLDVNEGPLVVLGNVNFVGNDSQPAEKLFDFAVGPTRERYSKMQKQLPFVEADVEEGVKLVRRLYVAEGFLDVIVQVPHFTYSADGARVDVNIALVEGARYYFGNVMFTGQTVFDAEKLRAEMRDLLEQPYTDARLADIPRRMQAFFKEHGYHDVKVDAVGDPMFARNDARVPIRVTIAPGPLYHFDGETKVTGLNRLQPTYITRRFNKLKGKTYSPEVVDTKFRDLMRSGLFNVLQIKPVPSGPDTLRLEVSAEEAKPKQFGVSVGYGSYAGAILGVQYRDLNIFGYGRPLTTSVEYTQRGYKGEIMWEDPYFLESEIAFRARVSALTFDYDGYSKFEFGGRIEFTRKLTKQYEVGLVLTGRHVDITSADIASEFLGDTKYVVSSLGFTHTLDLRDSKFVPTRGLVLDNTFDVASSVFGGDVDFARVTFRGTYFHPFGRAPKLAEPDKRTLLAIGARFGLIHSLTDTGSAGVNMVPIDERFFNGGSSTVRSFDERDLGPHDPGGDPIGGEFFTVLNVEYTFPIFGELQGAVFVDAGNLLRSSENPGLNDLRYALGLGLRYKLPIGPIRLDYGFNPDQRDGEAIGAFHFSFGFAF